MGNVVEAPALACTSGLIELVSPSCPVLRRARARSGTDLLEVVLVLLVVGHDWVVGVRKEETKEGGVYARGMDGTRRTRGGREKQ